MLWYVLLGVGILVAIITVVIMNAPTAPDDAFGGDDRFINRGPEESRDP